MEVRGLYIISKKFIICLNICKICRDLKIKRFFLEKLWYLIRCVLWENILVLWYGIIY